MSSFLLLAVALIHLFSSSAAMNFTATWIAGSNIANQPTTSTAPGARAFHVSFANSNGNLFVYGGYGFNSFSYPTYLSDMWKLDASTLTWSTIGSGSSNPTYGSRGQASNFVWPGILAFSSCAVSGIDPRAYCFGGQASQSAYYSNFLWRFDMSTQQWTFLSGSSFNVQSSASSQGTESSSNVPASRFSPSVTVSYISGNIYVFGGSCNVGNINDLWRYNFTSGFWAVLSGTSSGTVDSTSAIKGVSSPDIHPGSRNTAGLIYDNQCIYVFHGYGQYNGVSGSLNDVWKFDLLTNWWSYIAGANQAVNSPQVGKTTNVFSSTYTPGNTDGASYAYWKSQSLVIMFGGESTDQSANGISNKNFWVFNITSVQWMLLANLPAHYGSINITEATSYPGARSYAASASISSSNTFMIFGGTTAYNAFPSFSDAWLFSLSIPIAGTSQSTLFLSTTLQSSTPTVNNCCSFTPTPSSMKTTVMTTSTMSLPQLNNTYVATGGCYFTSNASTNTGLNITQPTNSLVIARLVIVSPTASLNVTDSTVINSSFDRNLTLIIAAIVGTLLVIVVAIITLFCYRKRKKKDLGRTEFAGESRDDLLQDATMTMTMTTFVSNQATLTELAQQTEFSVPGYLQFNVDRDFALESELAKGGLSKIYKARAINRELQNFGTSIVFKIVSSRRSDLDATHVSAFEQELAVHHYLGKHHNIADLLGWSETPLGMLLKLYSRGSLFDRVKAHEIDKKQMFVSYAMDISHGLEFMHLKKVAHCDIKPGNVLIDYDQDRNQEFCVLTDFGISQMYSQTSNLVHAFRVINMGGLSFQYAAPELFVKLRLGITSAGVEEAFQADIYAFGVVLKDLLCSHKPRIITRTKPKIKR